MKKARNAGLKMFAGLKGKLLFWIVFLFTAFIMFASMYGNVKPTKLDVEKFSIAEETIRSPITIEDKEQTEKKKHEAVNQVKPQYVMKHEYAQNRVDLISSIFQASIDLRKEWEKEKQDFEARSNRETEWQERSVEEKTELLKERLTEHVISDLSDETIRALVNYPETDLSIAKDAAVTAVNKVMTKRISAADVEDAKNEVEEEIRQISLPGPLKNATVELGRYAVIQNEFYDPEATEELRQLAVEDVEPVRILQGQIIVEEGELIDQEIYRQLELLGLVNSDASLMPFIGLGLLIFILLGLAFPYFYKKCGKSLQKEWLIFCTVLTASILLMKGISIIPVEQFDLAFLFPAATESMLVKLLIDKRPGIVGVVILAVCGAVIFNDHTSGSFHLTISLYILISGICGITFLSVQNHRPKIFQTGLYVSLINVALIIAFLFIPNSKFSISQYVLYSLSGIASGISSSVLTIGFLPVFEAGFGILSTMKLIELSNPNHPLLKKILTEAPGTYHHSIMVANLADRACEAVGANGLLARVASYYHDIGKTKRPHFFIENQMNMENPHERLDPETSRDIILAHTKDGAEILRQHNMPREIIDVALQHHGTSLLKYFYHKAKENGDVTESDFRYPGPKPKSKEIAIISIADSVEAAVRSMQDPTKEKIEKLVHNIIKDKLNDGQFSECDLTFKELSIIEKTLCETLYGIFHNRIEYPDSPKER